MNLAEEIERAQTIEVDATASVSGQSANGYSVSLTNVRGKVMLNWINPNSIVLKVEIVYLWAGEPGSGSYVYAANVNGPSGSFDTGQTWGPGWSASIIAVVWGGAETIATTPVTT